jgi:hypothetical protein
MERAPYRWGVEAGVAVTGRFAFAVAGCVLLACSSGHGAATGVAGGAGAAGGSSAGAAGGSSAGAAGGSSAGAAGGSSAGAAGGSACQATRASAPTFPGSRDPAILARAAVVVGSCIPDDGIDRNLADMWLSDVNQTWFWERTVLQAPCLASAKCGCAAVDACLGWKVTPYDGGACPTCAGSLFSLCGLIGAGTQLRLSFDCAAIGYGCDPVTGCLPPAAALCDETTFAPTCADGRPALCAQNYGTTPAVVPGAACAAVGAACAEGACVGSGAACTDLPASNGELVPAPLACAGAMLDACVGGKHQAIDCAKRGPGFTCQTVDGQVFCGLAAECVPGTPGSATPGSNRCEGDTVVLCNAGRIDRVDCRALGFSGCAVDASKGKLGCLP